MDAQLKIQARRSKSVIVNQLAKPVFWISSRIFIVNIKGINGFTQILLKFSAFLKGLFRLN